MDCSKILDMVYEEEGTMPILNQIQIWLHVFFCSDCAKKIEKLEAAKDIMRHDFFPSSPDIEDSIMAKIAAEEEQETVPHLPDAPYAIPGGLSTRGWVIAGVIILVSLATSFFGFNFQRLATESGTSFILPMGITIGIVLSTYGALFIGSHLKELSERFGL